MIDIKLIGDNNASVSMNDARGRTVSTLMTVDGLRELLSISVFNRNESKGVATTGFIPPNIVRKDTSEESTCYYVWKDSHDVNLKVRSSLFSYRDNAMRPESGVKELVDDDYDKYWAVPVRLPSSVFVFTVNNNMLKNTIVYFTDDLFPRPNSKFYLGSLPNFSSTYHSGVCYGEDINEMANGLISRGEFEYSLSLFIDLYFGSFFNSDLSSNSKVNINGSDPTLIDAKNYKFTSVYEIWYYNYCFINNIDARPSVLREGENIIHLFNNQQGV